MSVTPAMGASETSGGISFKPAIESNSKAPKKQAPRISCCDATRMAGFPPDMTVGALIVAAGLGERTGGALPKQYQLLAGKPVLRWSVEALANAGVDRIVVAIGPDQEELARAAVGDRAVT